MSKIVKGEILVTGSVFGYMQILRIGSVKYYGKQKDQRYVCECIFNNCGTVKEVSGNHLKRGNIQSCGCYQKQRSKETNTTHGMKNTPLYKNFHNMKQRCENKDKDYTRYGGRGIKIDKIWLGPKGFENFLKWNNSLSLKKQWKNGLEIDRINNNKGYSPNNCRWVTKKVNANNKRSTMMVGNVSFRDYYDSTENAPVSYNTARVRFKRGLPAKKAVSAPLLKERKVS